MNLAISLGKTSSATGLDKIDFNIISHLPESIRSLLVSSFNRFFQDGLFFSSWKELLVFFIPTSVPGKFRRISLASCVLKLMERLLYFRMAQWLEKQGLLPASQFGFRKSRSCCDNLSILTTEIYTGFVENEYTSSIFLDISSAFDKVDPNILAHDLCDLGLPWTYCKFIFNLTSSRSVYFKIAGQTHRPFNSYKGVPEGCILSPLLYILYTRNLEYHLHPRSDCLQFADDVVIYSRSSTVTNPTASLQDSIERVSNYLILRSYRRTL